MNYFAIDPGKKGAVAILSADNTVIDLCDLPYIGDSLDPVALADILSQADGLCGALESPLALKGLAVGTVMMVGKNYGQIRATVALAKYPYEEVTPAKWKRDMKVTADKDSAVALALKLYPDQHDQLVGPRGGKFDGRAEALLIAAWKRQKEMGL